MRPTMRPLWDPAAWYSTTEQLTRSVSITVNDETWYCLVDVNVLVAPHGVGSTLVHTDTIQARSDLNKSLRIDMLSLPLHNGASNVLTVTYQPKMTRFDITTPVSYLYTTTQSFEVRYDSSGPAIALIGARNDAFSESVVIAVEDAVSGLSEWSIDIRDDTGFSYSRKMVTPTSILWPPTLIPEGMSSVVTVTAQDRAGNQTIEVHRLVYDTTPPQIVSSGFSGAVFSSAMHLELADASSGIDQWQLDVEAADVQSGNRVHTETSVYTNTQLSWIPPLDLIPGAVVTFSVTAEDRAGNFVTRTHTAIYDPLPPDIVISGIESTAFDARVISYSTSTGIVVTASDGVSGIEQWQLNIEDSTGYTMSTVLTTASVMTWVPTAIVDGAWFTVSVEARDVAGNVITNVQVLLKDTAPPNIDVSGFMGIAFRDALSITVSDEVGGIRDWSLVVEDDRGMLSTSVHTSASTVVWTPSGLPDGALVTFTVAARDVLGNTENWTTLLAYDLTTPTLKVTGHASGSGITSLTRRLHFDMAHPDRSGILPMLTVRVEARGVSPMVVTTTMPADWLPDARFNGRLITVTAIGRDAFGAFDVWHGQFLYSPQVLVSAVMHQYCDPDRPLRYGYDCWEPNNWFTESREIVAQRSYYGAVYRDMAASDPLNMPSASDRRDFYRIYLAPWHTYDIELIPLGVGEAGDIDLYLYAAGVDDLSRYAARSDRSGGIPERIALQCLSDWTTYVIVATAYDTPKDMPRKYTLVVNDTGVCEPR
jgi:hypothetical protein